MKLYTVKNFARKNRESGTWPDSEPSLWALRQGSPENGFGKVFFTVGGRVLIDEEEFLKVIKELKK